MGNGIAEILNSFVPVSLSEMESVKLLNRIDTKFIVNTKRLPFLLRELCKDYYVLEINGIRNSHYKTLYFDTPELELYTQHHNGKLNRYKVRLRRYEESNLNFFEIKFKSNKSRTVKERITRKNFEEDIHGKSLRFLKEKVETLADNPVVPAIYVYYSRITLVGKNNKERLTIDSSLSYSHDEKNKSFPQLCIIELKQDQSEYSPALKLFQTEHIHSFSISKYCLGIASLYDDVKKNNFKMKLNKINKICNEKH